MSYDFSGQKIAIIGLARSGLAAANVLSRRGALVTIYDSKSANELDSQIGQAREYGVNVVTEATSIALSDVAIVSPGVQINSQILKSIREIDVPIWGEIEAAYRIAKAPILAVTGTNGKTTTALLLAEMVRAGGVKTYAGGNIAAGSLALPLIAAADLAQEGEAIVAEISSFQLETIVEFRPKVAAILNITSDHQDRQSWSEYVDSKWRLFENQKDGDTAVLHSDLPLPTLQARLPKDVVYFDKQQAPVWIEQILLPGAHNRSNTIAAAMMASAFGVFDEAIKSAALSFKGVVHRLEYVGRIGGVDYINNSMCTNNAAFASSLAAIVGPKVVLAGGVFKGGDMSPIAEGVAKNQVDLLILFGRSAEAIAETVRRQTIVETIVVETLADATRLAEMRAYTGQTVILNPGCTSLDQFKDFEDRGNKFKELVNNLGQGGK